MEVLLLSCASSFGDGEAKMKQLVLILEVGIYFTSIMFDSTRMNV